MTAFLESGLVEPGMSKTAGPARIRKAHSLEILVGIGQGESWWSRLN